ncbi:MAG: hypothetical protein ACK4SX_08130 [Alcanivoracaceae bacterium]
MTIHKAIAAGIAGDQLSRSIARTDEVSAGRSAIAVGSGALLGGAATGALAVGAGAVGASALAAVAAPVILPMAVVSGGIALLCSLWE